MAVLPTDRTTANTDAEHVGDHNELHGGHNLNETHRGRTDNPHATTAAQVGAVATADHTKAVHDALGIDAATIGGVDLASLLTEAEAAGTYQPVSEKGQANGYAALGADGLVPATQLPASSGSSLYDAALATITTVNNAAEQTHYSKSIAAGDLEVGGAYRLRMIGDWLNNSGVSRSPILRVKFGGATGWQDTVRNLWQDADRRAWELDVLLVIEGAAAEKMGGHLLIGAAATPTVGTGDASWHTAAGVPEESVLAPLHGSAAVAISSARDLVVTWQLPVADASLEIRTQFATLERLA